MREAGAGPGAALATPRAAAGAVHGVLSMFQLTSSLTTSSLEKLNHTVW